MIQYLFCGELSTEYKSKITKYISVIIPKRELPNYFNMLVESRTVANTYDPFTSAMIITSDVLLDVNYTEVEMKQDFPDYIS